jgi:dTDP-glucose 4,6-dehydratase
MKLLVTGGAGFIGSNFIRYWLSNHPDDHVVNLDALTYAGNLKNLHGINESHYTFIHGDICDPEAVRKAMSGEAGSGSAGEGVDLVVHCAAETHVDRSIQDGQIFLKTNVMGTHVLLEEAKRRGDQIKRFHHISTDEVFGALKLDDPKKFDEATPYDPRSPYSASKAAADHLVRAYYHTHGVPVTISNCSNNYGPYHFPEKFIPLMIVNALRDLPLPIYGDGLNVRDWMHVEDHCRGVEAILLRGKIGATYCLGGQAERANLEVAKLILDVLKKPHSLITFVEDRKGHDRRYAIDSRKAMTELGWKPHYAFEDGLRQTIQWYVENHAWWEPLLKKT